MKKLITIILTLSLLAGVSSISAAESMYIEKQISVVRDDGTEDAITVRFYNDQPNVPYFGLRAYSEFVGNNPLTCETDKDGRLVFTNTQGMQALFDPASCTLTTEDWMAFHSPALPYEGKPISMKDSFCAFIRVTDVTFEGEPQPTVLDFGKYGLKAYPEDNDLFLSLTLISSIMCDVDSINLTWNGEKAFLGRFGEKGISDDYLDSSFMQDMLTNGKRPEDTAAETYAEMCFTFDNFFGHPGVAPLDAALKEKGLDQALKDLGEEGVLLTEKLQSTDTAAYIAGINELFFGYLDDGHTANTLGLNLLQAYLQGEYSGMPQEDIPSLYLLLMDSSTMKKDVLRMSIMEVQEAAWGTDYYREYGNTAIIRLTDFMPDEAGWAAYYRGEGEIPQDTAGIALTGLRKAAENPEITNVLFDLSWNNGGSSDQMLFVTALATGANRLHCIEEMSGRKCTVTVDVDTNLDGVFDEKDQEAVYDQFHYGVLTSKQAFSCGNLFPFIMQEAGAVLIGEPTGGGSCCIQVVSTPDGFSFLMSSVIEHFMDQNWVSVESGCKTDLPIEHDEGTAEQNGITVATYDYSSYYNEEMLDEMLNHWFGEETLASAA